MWLEAKFHECVCMLAHAQQFLWLVKIPWESWLLLVHWTKACKLCVKWDHDETDWNSYSRFHDCKTWLLDCWLICWRFGRCQMWYIETLFSLHCRLAGLCNKAYRSCLCSECAQSLHADVELGVNNIIINQDLNATFHTMLARSLWNRSLCCKWLRWCVMGGNIIGLGSLSVRKMQIVLMLSRTQCYFSHHAGSICVKPQLVLQMASLPGNLHHHNLGQAFSGMRLFLK